ncbi:MAG TPA: hypothetical protein DEO95_08170 [Ruminococcaceae bacterium]|nr:hypothetical protein [Oscillospiraceae bacterium]
MPAVPSWSSGHFVLLLKKLFGNRKYHICPKNKKHLLFQQVLFCIQKIIGFWWPAQTICAFSADRYHLRYSEKQRDTIVVKNKE